MEIFFHELTETDVGYGLSVSSRARPHLPRFTGGERAQYLTVIDDEEGNTWRFRYRIRKGKYKKPELSVGWLDFVRSKHLKRGDKIRLFKEKEVRVFGAVFGYTSYHPEENEGTGVIVRYRIEVMKEVN